MKTVLTAFMMLSAVSGGVPQRTPPALPLRAIYILHLGESDKPLWPFVLALEEPQPSDVARILQEPFWRHADIFVVPARMLEDVARIVRDDQDVGMTPEWLLQNSRNWPHWLSWMYVPS